MLFPFWSGCASLNRRRRTARRSGQSGWPTRRRTSPSLPIDTAVTVASLVFGGVYELPGLKIVFSTAAVRSLLVGRWDHGYRDRLAKETDTTIKLPSEYLKDIYADSLTHDPAAVRYLVERLGQDQVVLGSDHPFDMGEADPVGKVKEAIDDPEVVQKILGGTAGRLLNLA